MKEKTKKIIYVKWIDSFYLEEECKEIEILDEMILETCGFFIGESKKYITLATEWSESQETWQHVHSILKTNIITKKIMER